MFDLPPWRINNTFVNQQVRDAQAHGVLQFKGRLEDMSKSACRRYRTSLLIMRLQGSGQRTPAVLSGDDAAQGPAARDHRGAVDACCRWVWRIWPSQPQRQLWQRIRHSPPTRLLWRAYTGPGAGVQPRPQHQPHKCGCHHGIQEERQV